MIEVKPIKSLNTVMSVPGSKYVANRLLVICSLAEGISVLNNVPDNEDINKTIGALKRLGAVIKKEDGVVILEGTSGKLGGAEIDVGESGTLLRFITGLAALAKGKTTITGSERIQERPVADLLDGLKQLGSVSRSNNGFPPVILEGATLKGGTAKVMGNVSSQFVSSLLLIASYAEEDVEILVEEGPVSKSYIDMTVDLMEEFGVSVERTGYEKFKIRSGQRYRAKEYVIPADFSSANYFLAAAAIIPGTVKVTGLDTSQKGEARFADVLAEMGCDVNRGEESIEVTGNDLVGIDVDMSDMPDAVLTLAAVALFATGRTTMRNIGHLRYKESDRIKDTVAELRRVGGKAEAGEDKLVVEESAVHEAVIKPHNDHRMAMSFGVIGLKTGMKIEDHECVSKSFPGFWDRIMELHNV
jgi:3-phosphoshikimate 1-carboxyvinyltransferase